jgi:hypothetical protein
VYNWILVTKKASIRLILYLLDQEDEEIELFFRGRLAGTKIPSAGIGL